MVRRGAGIETWHRLLDWHSEQAASERLAAQLLSIEGYRSIDPSHPLGGPDGLKDMVCTSDDRNWVVGVYFPRGQQNQSAIDKKFTHDLKGVSVNKANGFIFVTNQEIKLSHREKLANIADDTELEIFHLERISTILNTPACYGTRLEFLDMDMTKEEQVAFIAHRDIAMIRIEVNQNEILSRIKLIEKGKTDLLKKSRQDPYRVTPQLNSSMVSASIYGESVHRCSNCKFGYLVDPPNRAALVLWSDQTVTCPNCGNIEKYHGGLFG